MLHDPSHHTPPPVAAEIKLTDKDTEILRVLAGEFAKIASLPTNTICLLRQLSNRSYLRDLLHNSAVSYFLLPASALLAKILADFR